MFQDKRIENSIASLRESIQRYQQNDLVKISEDRIEITGLKDGLYGTAFYFILLVIFPLGMFCWYMVYDSANNAVFVFFLLPVLMVYNLHKMITGNTSLTIFLQKKVCTIENINPAFRKLFRIKTIALAEIIKVELTSKSASRGNSWYRLQAFDEQQNKIVLTDFKNTQSQIAIAEKIKFLLETLIRIEHKK
ncbi:MAG TPA: hypothetical protein PLP23_19815 [Panacibacter sp.]|nr:hypothetical protein [Panacibacter sp.]